MGLGLGYFHTWPCGMLFLMSIIFGNSGISAPDCFTVPEVAGGKGCKVCLFYFFIQTISQQILPGCLYLDKAALCPVKGK